MATTFDRAALDTGALDIRPMTPAIGAEILSVDLGASNIADSIPAIRAALLKHGVIFFRDQDLTQEQTSHRLRSPVRRSRSPPRHAQRPTQP